MSGDVDPATGMIANLADLDAFVERSARGIRSQVAQRRYPAFSGKVPTTENLCIEIFQRLKSFPKAKSNASASRNRKQQLRIRGGHLEGNRP